MKKSNPKKSKSVDKTQPSIMDYIVADDLNKSVYDVMTQRLELAVIPISHRREKDVDSLDDKEEPILRSEQIHVLYNERVSEFCKLSNNLYIEGNILMRENFFENQRLKLEHWKLTGQKLKVKYLTYGQLDKMLQSNDNYVKLGACAQQTLMVLINDWTSYWEAIKDYSKDNSKYLGEPRIPKRRKIDGEFVLTLSNQQCYIESGLSLDDKLINWLVFPDWMGMRFEYPNGSSNRIKTRLSDNNNLREVRIVPKGVGYNVEIVYKKVIDKKIEMLDLNKERIIGLDFGKRNLVTIANNIGAIPIAIKGSVVLAINQFYNKMKGKLQKVYESQSLKPKIGNALLVMNDKHDRRILDVLHKYSRWIINYCIKNNVGTIVIGYNPEWKQKIKLGRKTNQGFGQIPHYSLYEMITYKAFEVGIQVIEQEESHTSKCSFLDNESIEHHSSYMGRRRGGLFTSLTGRRINSDVQGAYNIIKKAVLRLTSAERANAILKMYPCGSMDRIAGVRLHPIRINPLRSNVSSSK